MTPPSLLVCGFGRCGTSLVMQMLEAGGYPVVGRYPAYEPNGQYDRLTAGGVVAELATGEGKAMKLLDAHRWSIPKGPRKAIWLDRDPTQQAMSALKMLGAVADVAPTLQDVKAMAKSYKRDRPRAMAKLTASGADVLVMNFEDIVANPYSAALRMIAHTGVAMRPMLMARRVIPRTSQCLPYLLEAFLFEGCDHD